MGKTKTIDIGLEEAQVQVVDLEKELLVLRLTFGKLKAAVADAAAPIGAILVPALTRAANWASRLVKNIGKVIAALLGVQVVETKVATAAKAAGSAIKRSLAGFDQIERLNAGTGGGTAAATETVTVVVNGELTPQLQGIADRVRALLAPLAAMDFTALKSSLGTLGAVFTTVMGQIGVALEWVWYNLLTPFAAWTVETFAPAVADTLSGAFSHLSTVLTPVGQHFTGLWEAMQPVVAYIGDSVLWALEQMQLCFGELSRVVSEKGDRISATFANLAEAVKAAWAMIQPAFDMWKQNWSQMSQLAGNAAGFVIDALHAMSEFLAGVFTSDWGRAWQGICQYVKGSVNTVIGFLNAMLSCAVTAINGIVTALNKLSFTVPDWVPGLGGQTMGFGLKTVTAPQIPYLAKGAVLPANKPFLAMVGDQRHGTNVEAPLSTIQEAVALVMQDQTQAILAGFDASVGVQREILEAVLGIRIGDDVIATAVSRHQAKMAVMRGG